jgi:hypothetical protein
MSSSEVPVSTAAIAPPPPSARARKKRKLAEPRNVDITTLPDIDEIDLDSIKNFDKDQLRAYLRFYGAMTDPPAFRQNIFQ